MRRQVARVAGAVALCPALLAGAFAAACSPRLGSPGSWGPAIEVPDTAALSTGGSWSCTSPGSCSAGIASLACASPGYCSAVGAYGTVGSNHFGAFVVSQVGGKWRTAEEIPGLAALNKGHNASAGPVSCASPGDCSAGGSYRDARHFGQAFVVSEVHGSWRKAIEVPVSAALQKVGAGLSSISCTAPGDCSAGGTYTNASGGTHAFVVSEVRGTWRKAIEVPGIAALSTDGAAGISSVSCSSPGNCSADGSYKDTPGNSRLFVVSQVRGTWGKAIQMPGTAALGASSSAGVSSVSCGSAGNCAVVGYYWDNQGFEYPFIENQVSGKWGTATPVPGMAAFGQKSNGRLYAVSCGSPGNCAAAGSEGITNGFDVAGGGQPFVVTETNGTWGNAELVPGITALNTGVDGAVVTLSCASAGNCSAGGYYGIGEPDQKVYDYSAFVVSEVNGTWGTATQTPGLRALNKGKSAGIADVSCAAPGRCSAGGSYVDEANHGQAFVASEDVSTS